MGEEGNRLGEVLESLRGTLERIREVLREGQVPEVTRSYIEHLGRSIATTINVLEMVARENTIQSPLSPSARGAMYNLRRAFYATLSRLVKESGVDRERSVESWKAAASKIVDFINEAGISEAPTKIVVTYEVAEEGGVKYLKLNRAEILYFELEGVKTLDLG